LTTCVAPLQPMVASSQTSIVLCRVVYRKNTKGRRSWLVGRYGIPVLSWLDPWMFPILCFLLFHLLFVEQACCRSSWLYLYKRIMLHVAISPRGS
jgi:hypothetical protein